MNSTGFDAKVREIIRIERNAIHKRYLLTFGALVAIVTIGLLVVAQATVTPSHPANQVRAGAFQSGAYSFPGALSVASLSSSGAVSTGTFSASGSVSAGSLTGAGLANCNGANQKLIYTSATGTFSCGTDVSGATPPTIPAGTFQSGAYAFPGSLTVGTLFGASLPSCSGATQKLLYSSATGTFSCGTDSGATPFTSCVIRSTNNGGADNDGLASCLAGEVATGGGCRPMSALALVMNCASVGADCALSGTPTAWYCSYTATNFITTTVTCCK